MNLLIKIVKKMNCFLLSHEEKKEYKSLLKNYSSDFKHNSELEGTVSGRCFIFGNGPSLNDVDFNDLKNEDIFVLNLIANHKSFHLLKPKYYLVVDPYLFNDSENNERKNSIIKVCRNNPNIKMFTSLGHKNTELASTISGLCDIYFFKTYKRIRDYSTRASISKPIPGFGNVALYAIYIAIALGYKEIYLIGCDETNIVASINAQMGYVDDSAYGYTLTDDEKNRIIKTLTTRPFGDTLETFAGMFRDFDLINDYAKKNGCTIYNCSKKSLLKSFRYKDVKEALNDNNKNN